MINDLRHHKKVTYQSYAQSISIYDFFSIKKHLL